MPAEPLRVGFIEPHLGEVGGIRRVLTTANGLVARGHAVTVYMPEGIERRCAWMPCRARIGGIAEGAGDELDVVIFNDERQWHLVTGFPRARRRVFLALGSGAAYGKPGSWESVRAPVDAILANSAWTAERIEAETGRRPVVVPTGVDRELFRPVPVPVRHPVLCTGDARPWKGTPTIEEACRRLGLPLRTIAGRDIRQEDLAVEICSAEVFVVGSTAEGFGFPGLEALACGVPLVTTDAGGPREYAIDGETALVVPVGDPEAMAEAIARVRADAALRERLVRNGLDLVARRFTWEHAVAGFEAALAAIVAAPPAAAPGRRGVRDADAEPRLSVVVLPDAHLGGVQACVERIRRHTTDAYELLLVEPGAAAPELALYLAQAGDALPAPSCRGPFADAAAAARCCRAPVTVVVDPAAALPSGWSERLLEAFADPSAGVVVATAAAEGPRAVRVPPRARLPEGLVIAFRGGVEAASPLAFASPWAQQAMLCLAAWDGGLAVLELAAGVAPHPAASRRLTARRASAATEKPRVAALWKEAAASRLDFPRRGAGRLLRGVRRRVGRGS